MGDGIRHILTHAKGLILCLAWQIDEQRVCITIYHLCTPFLVTIDDADSLQNNSQTSQVDIGAVVPFRGFLYRSERYYLRSRRPAYVRSMLRSCSRM